MNLTELKAFIAKVEADLNGANPDMVVIQANNKKIKQLFALLPAKTIPSAPVEPEQSAN